MVTKHFSVLWGQTERRYSHMALHAKSTWKRKKHGNGNGWLKFTLNFVARCRVKSWASEPGRCGEKKQQRERWRVWEKRGAVKKEVLSYLMSQSHSNDKEVWFSLACDLCAAVYNTISIQSQPVINVQQGQNSTKGEGEREGEREQCVWSVCGCVSLNLSPLHTPQPCVRVSTRAEAESTGVRELEAGPVDTEEEPTGGRDRWSNRKSFPALMDFKRNIWSTVNDIKYTDIHKSIFYCTGCWHRTFNPALQWQSACLYTLIMHLYCLINSCAFGLQSL